MRTGGASVRRTRSVVTRSRWETDSQQIAGDRARSRPCFVEGIYSQRREEKNKSGDGGERKKNQTRGKK